MAIVTTGFFDGVHLGHRHVLETLVSSARERGEEAVVVTFWPHPRTVLQQDAREFRLLTSLEEKRELLLSAGVDKVEVLPFTRSFARLTAAEYLQLLRDRFGASQVVMGYDNRIGSDRKSAEELMDDCSLTTPLRVVGPLRAALPMGPSPSWLSAGEDASVCHSERSEESPEEQAISSTQIRKALGEGRIDLANAMLGYRYQLYGVVVAGNRLGRTMGFPTANMQLYEPLKLVPGNGVYAVEVEVLGSHYTGMCNVGMRPTVGGTTRTIETHILDFDQDIYGLPLRLRFFHRIRDERTFPSLDALKLQLQKDAVACRTACSSL